MLFKVHIQSYPSRPKNKNSKIRIGYNLADDEDVDNVFSEVSSTLKEYEGTNSLGNWSDTNQSHNNFSDDGFSRVSLQPNSYYFRRPSIRRCV